MKRLINFSVFAITILTLNLLTGIITNFFFHYKKNANPFKFTALGMLVIVVIFYPVFEFMEKKIAEIVRKAAKHGDHIMGKYIGIITVFIVILFALYCIYAKIWFNIDVLKIIWHSIISII